MLNITEVRVRTYEAGKLRGYADVTIGGGLAIKGFKIMYHEQNGLWVANPSKPKSGGGYEDIAFPLNPDAREELKKAILDKFNEAVRSQDKTPENEPASQDSGFAAVDDDDDVPF